MYNGCLLMFARPVNTFQNHALKLAAAIRDHVLYRGANHCRNASHCTGGIEAQKGVLGFVQQVGSAFVQPYLVVGIEAEQGGRQLGVSVHDVVHLDIWREGANVVVLDAAQLQIKQSLQQQQGECQ